MGETPVGTPITLTNFQVVNGTFTTDLNFPGAFTGTSSLLRSYRWIASTESKATGEYGASCTLRIAQWRHRCHGVQPEPQARRA